MSAEKVGPVSDRPADVALAADSADATTGLPALRTWRAVYTVVLGIFLLWIALLTWLTAAYS